MATLTIADLDNGKRDLQTVEEVANSRAATATTRFGQQTTTLYEAIRRINEKGDAQLAAQDSAATELILSLGFRVPVPYESGLDVSDSRFTVTGPDGKVYAPLSAPFTTGAWDASQWYVLQNDLNDHKLLIFETEAAANAAAATLPDGQTVDALDTQLRYEASGGLLVPIGRLPIANFATTSQVSTAMQAGSVRSSESNTVVDSAVSTVENGVWGFEGIGESTVFKKDGSIDNRLFRGFYNKQARLSRFSVDISGVTNSTTGMTLDFADAENLVVSDVSIKGFGGTGSGVINYSTDIAKKIKNVRYRNSNFEGVYDSSVNTNGFLQETVQYSFMTGLFAAGAKAFGIEYKNNASHSIIGNSIGVDSDYAFGYGQTTSDDTGVSHTSASNMVAHNSGYGWVFGKAKYNHIGGGVVHNDAATSRFPANTTHGLRFQLNSNGNLAANWIFAGDMFYPARFDAVSNNFVSGAFHNNTQNAAIFGAGATRNVVEIQHPGTRSTITGNTVNDTSGNTSLSGATANPVFCHATGEYRGSMSGRWRWMHDTSGVSSLASNRKWVFESKGDSFADVMTDGVGVAGFSVTSPLGTRQLQYSFTNSEWRLSTGGTEVRISSAQIAPSVTGVMSLGNSALRFSNAYTDKVTVGTVNILSGSGSPEGTTSAPPGSLYLRSDPTSSSDVLYVKVSGTGSIGWVAK